MVIKLKSYFQTLHIGIKKLQELTNHHKKPSIFLEEFYK